MAHEIDFSLGRAAIAFAGQIPWHGLGEQLTSDAPLDVWQREAGLAWSVERAPAMYRTPDGTEHPAARDVLYRSDTKAALGVVSKTNYHPVQPDEVMGFFKDLTEKAGFKMEVAGSLKGGKRIWALARVGQNAVIGKDDEVAPYLLLSTAFDGSAATIGQLTSIRVVCNNTISAADRENATRVSVWHCTKFDAEAMKMDLGIVAGSFDSMVERFNMLAKRRVGARQVDDILAKVLDVADPEALNKSRGYQKIMGLFEGGAMGADLKGSKGTAWGLLNSVTEYVDHYSGLSDDTRMTSAWFGKGNTVKSRALELVSAL
jgi:phage/plasmid-like protein (TIGR03299 family)